MGQNKKIVLITSEEFNRNNTSKENRVVEPQYDPDTDEPAFERTWERMRELEEKGLLKPVPKFPEGGVKLRKPHVTK